MHCASFGQSAWWRGGDGSRRCRWIDPCLGLTLALKIVDLPHRYRRPRLPALERLRPHLALSIFPRRSLLGARHSLSNLRIARIHCRLPSHHCARTRLLRPTTPRIDRRVYPPNLHDAHVRWNKVGAAQASTSVRSYDPEEQQLGEQAEPLEQANVRLTAAMAHAARHRY